MKEHEDQAGTARQDDFFETCSRCGFTCCRDAKPPITPPRKKLIETYLSDRSLNLKRTFIHRGYVFPREKEGRVCIFQDKSTRRCMVHEMKPETCTAGPITFDINRKTGMIEWYLKSEKICPLAGRLYRDPNSLRRHLGSARKELTALVRELDGESLSSILKIEEPDTFKIDEDKLNPEILEKIEQAEKEQGKQVDVGHPSRSKR